MRCLVHLTLTALWVVVPSQALLANTTQASTLRLLSSQQGEQAPAFYLLDDAKRQTPARYQLVSKPAALSAAVVHENDATPLPFLGETVKGGK